MPLATAFVHLRADDSAARRTLLSPWATLVTKSVRLPGQTSDAMFHSLKQADCISILAVTADNKVPLVRQFRPAQGKTSFEEKTIARTHIKAGIYVFEPEALDALSRGGPCDMPTLFARLQEKKLRTIVYPMHEPWPDVGPQDDLDRAHLEQSTNMEKSN